MGNELVDFVACSVTCKDAWPSLFLISLFDLIISRSTSLPW